MVNFFPTAQYGDILTWALIIVLVVVGARVIAFLIQKVFKVITKKTKTTLDDKLLEAFEKSLTVLAAFIITYFAANDLPFFVKHPDAIKVILFIITVFGLAYIIIQFVLAVLKWYGEEVSEKTESELDDIFIPILRKITGIIIYLIALTIVLARMGVSITPILASLGVASLAIALALKDTLAEFFAGFYIMADRPMKKGDLVKLDGGQEGIFVDIGGIS